MSKPTVGIIGFGRFGRFWAKSLSSECDILVSDIRLELSDAAVDMKFPFVGLAEICAKASSLFLCVPINQLDVVVNQIRPLLKPGTAIMDTCSVKLYPSAILNKCLGDLDGVELIATHPMFGPDSGAHGLKGLPMTMWPLGNERLHYKYWHQTFDRLGLHIVEIPPDEHDRLAANSQGIAQYIGRVLGEMNLCPTPIDTQGFRLLLTVVNQTCNDSWELFHDLQMHNPYTSEMRLRLETALSKVYGRLLPERVSPSELVIGIQGGRGSFNEEACRRYCALHPDDIDGYRIEYLYTTANVLNALHHGTIDRGVFAIQNAKGGAVMETIHALSRYNCEIVNIFDVVISHCLMHHPDAMFEEIDTVISHPQALAQCSGTLRNKYANLKLASGDGDRIDQALCAQLIAEDRLPRSTAVLASRVCAELYGLTIHEVDLQDLGQANLTTFAWVKRRHLE